MYEDVFYSPELRKAFHELFIIELYLTNNLVRMTLGITWKLYLCEWHLKSIGNCTCGNGLGNQLRPVLVGSIGNCNCGNDCGNQLGTVLVGMTGNQLGTVLVVLTLGIKWELYLWEWHWKSIGNCTCANDFGN